MTVFTWKVERHDHDTHGPLSVITNTSYTTGLMAMEPQTGNIKSLGRWNQLQVLSNMITRPRCQTGWIHI
jgi:hypothetical protein